LRHLLVEAAVSCVTNNSQHQERSRRVLRCLPLAVKPRSCLLVVAGAVAIQLPIIQGQAAGALADFIFNQLLLARL
jgi:hypothetical protein